MIGHVIVLGSPYSSSSSRNFHLNQLKELLIVNHITFVHEYNDVRNTYLTGKKDVLFSLSHNTIGSCYYKDSTIHLSCTSDHVLYIVSMARAVNVCVMSVLGLDTQRVR